MATLTNAGRTWMAAAIQSHPLHLAWGSGSRAWGKSHRVSLQFDPHQTRLSLPHSFVKAVVVTTEDETRLIPDRDYLLETVSGCLTRLPSGRLPDNATVIVQYTEATPPESPEATQLIHLMGLRSFDTVVFCTPHKQGALSTPQGNFAISEAATTTLYLSCRLDFSEAVGQTIQEVGVMVGAQTAADLPPGQRYFTPDQIRAPGTLLVLEHLAPLKREATTRDAFSFVVNC